MACQPYGVATSTVEPVTRDDVTVCHAAHVYGNAESESEFSSRIQASVRQRPLTPTHDH